MRRSSSTLARPSRTRSPSLREGVTFSRTESPERGLVFDRYSVAQRVRPAPSRRSAYDFEHLAPPARPAPADPDALELVNLAAPECVWSWGKGGVASIKRYETPAAAAASAHRRRALGRAAARCRGVDGPHTRRTPAAACSRLEPRA